MEKFKLIKISLALLIILACGPGCGKNKDNSELVSGLDLFVREEYDSSIVAFSRIIREDPKNTQALFYRAVAHKKKNDPVKSVLDFEKIFEIDRNFSMKPEDLYSIAEYNYTQRKDFKKAISLFQLFIEKYPKNQDSIRAYIEIADSYSLQKDFDKALEGYKKIVEVYGKGKTSIEQKAVKLAEEGIKFLVENSDYDRKPLSLYADMDNEWDPVKKIEMGKKILEKYPDCNLADDIQFKIARLTSVDGLNDFDKAQAEYLTLIKKYPKSKYVDFARNSIMGIDQKYDRKTGKLKGTVH